MTKLTPEEKQKIYEEEKARLEARAKIEKKQRPIFTRPLGCFFDLFGVVLLLSGIVSGIAVFTIAGIIIFGLGIYAEITRKKWEVLLDSSHFPVYMDLTIIGIFVAITTFMGIKFFGELQQTK